MSESQDKNDLDPLQRERFLSVLNDITYATLEIRDVDELLQLLADRLAEIIDADGCFLTLWQEETQTVFPAAAYGPLRESYRQLQTSPGEPTITKATMEAGHTLIIADAWNSGYAAPQITRQFPSRSMLAIPLRIAEQKLGAALISFDEPHEFSATEIEYCEQAVRQISLAIANAQTMTALKRSEQEYRQLSAELKKREVHMNEAQKNAKMGSWEQGLEPGTTVWSPGMFRLFDLPQDSRPPNRETFLSVIAPADRAFIKSIVGKPELAESITPFEFQTIHGKHLFGEIFFEPTKGRLSGTLQDVTQQRSLEAELFQARKMEAVGTLAGGIAHNFNNILTVIMGNYELLSDSVPSDSSERRILEQCFSATERAALLTKQLLVVSRKHELNPEFINTSELVVNLAELLAPLLGEHIQLNTELADQPMNVHADRGHLEQVMINLVLNARDALPDGGNVTISTANLAGQETQIAISVSDNGTGISEQDLPHIFDPFFTTKDEGKGTGLGLATVQSIVQQSHGKIEVESHPDQGTRVTVLLPEITGARQAIRVAGEVEKPTARAGLNANILLVEDHESLRNVAKFVLERAGYKVVATENGQQAFEQFDAGVEFDLLLTDVQLPGGMSGIGIAERFRQETSQPIIFMSGLRESLPKLEKSHFLAKPFRPNELLNLVEIALEPATVD